MVVDRVLRVERAVQAADGLAVVGKLREVLRVVGELDAGRDGEVRQGRPRILNIGFPRACIEMHIVDPAALGG